MRILVAYRLPPAVEAVLGTGASSYYPDLAGSGSGPWQEAIAAVLPHVVAADRAPAPDDLAFWDALMPAARRFLLVKGDRPHEPPYVPARSRLSVHWLGPYGTWSDIAVLREAERLYTKEVVTSSTLAAVRAQRQRRRRNEQSVVVVGAGIVGLMTAWELTRAGYRVHLVDAGPDPRSRQDWRRFGCTRGGGNARMFTLTEADNYNDQGPSPTTSPAFRIAVSQGGWRISGDNGFGPQEHEWIERHERVPPWLARLYNRDIFSFNKESEFLWRDLRLEVPQLFDGVELHDGIVRLYTDPAHLAWSEARHSAIGALRRRLDPADIRACYPALADACRHGPLVGALEVVGFTLSVHNLVTNMLDALQHAGARVTFQARVTEISRNARGLIAGLVTLAGPLEADHYVLSPGVYGQRLLTRTVSANRIHGVLGVWVTLPNLEPKLQNSLKIARKGHRAEDANVTVTTDGCGQDILLYGSGYGYTGLSPDNICPDELEALHAAVEDNVQTFFPAAYAAARESGLLVSSRRFCVRPWTPNGLGVLEVQPATSGLLIVVGGHNTGGFTQSPSVARAVLCTLRGRPHPMQWLYHPGRASDSCAHRAITPQTR